MKTGCVALVLCLNISVDPPDVIKISPCARMECWIGAFTLLSLLLLYFICCVLLMYWLLIFLFSLLGWYIEFLVVGTIC